MDMLSLSLKAMGVDPTVLLNQATQLGDAFGRIASGQQMMAAQLAHITDQLEAMQTQLNTLSGAMGLPVPLPVGSVAKLIADQSAEYIALHGGPAHE